MFEHLSDKNRLERIKQVVETDYSKRHDSAMLNLFPNDLDWLVEQVEKVNTYEKALRFYADTENYKLSAEAERADLVDFINILDMDNGDRARNALKG